MNHESLAKKVGARKKRQARKRDSPIIVWQIPYLTTKSQFTGQ